MVPLTVRSHYSLMWGTSSVEAVCRAARQRGFTSLALTDTDNLYGLWPFLNACERQGLRPIVGAEITDRATDRRAVCLVENDTGYKNLCRLLTRRHCDASFSLESALPEYGAGLVVLTQNPRWLLRWNEAGICVAGAMPRKPTGASHPVRETTRRLGLPLAATPGSFFLRPQDHALHRLVRAVHGNTSLSRLGPGDTAPPDAWLASVEEYRKRFSVCPEALAATCKLAERLTFRGPRRRTVLPPWDDPRGVDAGQLLRAAAYKGARGRYGDDLSETAVRRLEYELGVIIAKGFAPYFLVVQQIVRKSPRICGRGSGAASLVAYCMGITNVCPIKHDLYFERFLNPGRTDPPDIDVDFAWDERDAILEAVLSQYVGHGAMVCNHVLFQPRMAVREVAKVFGLTEREIGQVSRRLPWLWRHEAPEQDLLERLKELPEMRCLDFPHPWPQVLALAQRIMGLPRHLSVHPGGLVITPEPIDTYVPVERAAKGVPVIQWEKDGAEEGGLVKIDLLGNRSLGVIRDAIADVRAQGEPFDENRWEPEEDAATRKALARGQTMGCFYIESPAMRLLQKKTGAGDFAHLVVHSSIIRPAANEFIREYVRRLKGAAWDPIHPLLADVLEETLGIMVFQEDVSKVAVVLAGFSHGEADGLRKVLSKKDRVRHLRDYRERFLAGARARGVGDSQIQAVWDMIMSFSGYSFCKPHSASYARVSFQAAYLKVHHPAAFMAAVISNQGGFYSTFAYVSEARRTGLEILPPDVNHSPVRWTGRGRQIRVGLLSVKGLGEDTRQRIVALRQKGPYRGLQDFLDRVRPDGEEARALIHCGACDGLSPGTERTTLLWELARWRKDRLHNKAPCLFGKRPLPCGPRFPREDQRERLRRQFSVLSFLCDRHPMVLYAKALEAMGTVKAAMLPRLVGRRVRFAGWLITGKVVRTKGGEPMEFLTFEDETEIVETTFFPQAYRRFCAILDWGRPYLLYGKVEQDFGAVTLTVDGVEPLRADCPVRP